jgi:hypothetical protein
MKKKILLVDSIAESRGFFSTINLVLLNLQYCYENNLDPVISSSVLSLYGTQPKLVRPFSEFFGEIFSGEEENLNRMEISYVHNNNLLDFNNPEVVQNLTQINKTLVDHLNEEVKTFINTPPVGDYSNASISVHFRGCDYLKNVPLGHIPNIPPSEFLNKISSLIEGQGIFVATDDVQFINLIKSLQINLSYFEDVSRKGPGRGVHIKSFYERLGLINKHKQKKKGYEVMRDVYWLSKNNVYIGSNSNLMYYSKLLNPHQHQINLTAGT